MNNTIKIGWEAEIIEVILTPEKFPTAYENKVKELLEQEVFETREEAENGFYQLLYNLNSYTSVIQVYLLLKVMQSRLTLVFPHIQVKI